jgi:hypothetical protein
MLEKVDADRKFKRDLKKKTDQGKADQFYIF